MNQHADDANAFDETLEKLAQSAISLKGIRRGLEKESLRIKPDGTLSQEPHPKALGSTLTHPNITTDYSEALLELITEPHNSIADLLKQLEQTHSFIYQNIGDELLWVNSMPCILGGDESIPIAQYGSSNIGKMKTVYRHGLWHRYGRHMQAIAGIHFNFSLPEHFWKSYQEHLGNNEALEDFISAQYFKLIRNFQRYSWLIIYLFGASPAVCGTFVKNKQHKLDQLSGSQGTYYKANATSLRMSDLGYQNDAQSDLMICYNSLETYTKSLEQAIRTPFPAYEKIGIKENGEYKQLNCNILQIENEYYSSIRPKQTGLSGERPTQALRNRGVEYIEVRSLDLNPFEHTGLNAEQIKFLDCFLVFCLLEQDIQSNDDMLHAIAKNIETVVYSGRDTKAEIIDAKSLKSEKLSSKANKLLSKIEKVAQLMNSKADESGYVESVLQQKEKVLNPLLTASGKVISILENENISFFEFAMTKAKESQIFFKQQTLEPKQLEAMRNLAKRSLEEQKEVEANDSLDFDTFVANYFKD